VPSDGNAPRRVRAVLLGLAPVHGSNGRVISIDVDAAANAAANIVAGHPNIDLLLGVSASPVMVDRVRSLLKKGDYLVVEDTCVNGHPVRPQYGPGLAARLLRARVISALCFAPIPFETRASILKDYLFNSVCYNDFAETPARRVAPQH
jgi:hypothetical protein